MSFLYRRSPINVLEGMMRFVNKPTNSTGRGKNVHQSKRAQLGLYHGKDVQFGMSIAPHSKAKTLKKWLPNVINKRVWSNTLDDWVRFKMTTTALKHIDYVGGIDNYILSLDNKSVALSNYITKQRNRIGTSLFFKGELSPLYIRKLGYGRNPPVAPVAIVSTPDSHEDEEAVHLIEQSSEAIHSASVHVYNAEEGNTDIMKLDKSSDPKISPKVLILWSTISTDSDTRRLEDLLISRKCTVEKIDGADFENKVIRDQLFGISGRRAKYPQCFLIKNGTYQFVGTWEEVEALEECDSIPAEVLDAHPEIDTFTTVFFGRVKKDAAALLAKETARLAQIAKEEEDERLRKLEEERLKKEEEDRLQREEEERLRLLEEERLRLIELERLRLLEEERLKKEEEDRLLREEEERLRLLEEERLRLLEEERLRAEEEERLRLAEEERLKELERLRLAAIETARLKAEEEERLRLIAEEEARLKAEEEERLRLLAEEEARLKREEEERLRLIAEEEARLKAEEEERLRLIAEEEARLKREEEERLRLIAEEEARLKREEEERLRLIAEEEARLKREEEERLRLLAEEEARLKKEEEERLRLIALEEARLKREEEERLRLLAIEEARLKREEEERLRLLEEERLRKEREERLRLEEEERLRLIEVERLRKEEEIRLKKEEELRIKQEKEEKIRKENEERERREEEVRAKRSREREERMKRQEEERAKREAADKVRKDMEEKDSLVWLKLRETNYVKTEAEEAEWKQLAHDKVLEILRIQEADRALKDANEKKSKENYMLSLISKLKRRDSTGDSPGGTPARLRQGSSASKESYDSGDSGKKTPGMFPSSESPRSKTAEVLSRVKQQEEELGLSDSSTPRKSKEDTLQGKELFPGPSPPLTAEKLSVVTSDAKNGSPITPLTPSSPRARSLAVPGSSSIAKELFPVESPVASKKSPQMDIQPQFSPNAKAVDTGSPLQLNTIIKALDSSTEPSPAKPTVTVPVPANIVEVSEKVSEVAHTAPLASSSSLSSPSTLPSPLPVTLPPTPPTPKE